MRNTRIVCKLPSTSHNRPVHSTSFPAIRRVINILYETTRRETRFDRIIATKPDAFVSSYCTWWFSSIPTKLFVSSEQIINTVSPYNFFSKWNQRTIGCYGWSIARISIYETRFCKADPRSGSRTVVRDLQQCSTLPISIKRSDKWHAVIAPSQSFIADVSEIITVDWRSFNYPRVASLLFAALPQPEIKINRETRARGCIDAFNESELDSTLVAIHRPLLPHQYFLPCRSQNRRVILFPSFYARYISIRSSFTFFVQRSKSRYIG